MKKIIIIGIIILILIISIVVYSLSPIITGQAVEEEIYTFTKAICNETTIGEGIYCYDYEIQNK